MVATQLPRKRTLRQSGAFCKGPPRPSDQSVQSASLELVKRRPATTTSTSVDSRGRLLPNHYLICRLRDAARASGPRLVVEPELLDCKEPGKAALPSPSNIQDHRAQQQRNLHGVLCHSKCKHMNSAKSDRRFIFTKQQRPVRSSRPC